MSVVALRIASALSFAIACSAGCSQEHVDSPARRVILITCDTLRADHLGCYGYDRPTSPSLDAFARDAALFQNAWSCAPLTGPSISSLLSGKPPDECGAGPTNRELMPEKVDTLAEVLSRARIETAAFVSNGVLRRPPVEQGNIGVQQGFRTFDDEMKSKEVNRDLVERNAADCTDAALKWLDARKNRRDERFFLWIHFQDPHGPYTPPPETLKQLARDHASDVDLDVGKNNSGKGQIPRYQVYGSERKPGQYVDRYDAEIRGFDEQLGRLFAWLKQNAMWDDSLIVLTADHGEELGDHGYWFCHGETLNRELVRVPFIVRAPNALHVAARVEKRLVTHLDVWPTVLQALAVPPIKNRGVSLLDPTALSDRVCAQFLGPLRNPGRRLAVTDGRWRLVLVSTDPPKLYDLESDAGELHDLASEKAEIVETLKKRYIAYMSDGASGSVEGVPRKMDATATRAMNGLGYTDGDGDGH